MSICYNCFREIHEQEKCPFCGYEPALKKGKYPLALIPGTVLDGRYQIGRVLGQGGFGITYIAMDQTTRSRVAIKEYLPTEIAGRAYGTSALQVYSKDRTEEYESGKQQFLSEARTLSEFVGNEHIINIHGYFEENGTAYFAMEYMEGKTLKQVMEESGRPISVQQANRYLLPIMEALSWVHSKGIIHRDISPDNIMIRKDGEAKLIDFGAARYSSGEKSKSLDVILKHGFAPKEQYTRRGRQGPYTDVYAMAATYYYAITGRVPPDAIERSVEDEIISPSAIGTVIPASTEQILMKGLAVSPPDRYQTMEEFYHALLNSMEKPLADTTEETGGNTAATSLWTEGQNKPVRKKNKTGVALAAALAVIAGIGLFLFRDKIFRHGSPAGIPSPTVEEPSPETETTPDIGERSETTSTLASSPEEAAKPAPEEAAEPASEEAAEPASEEAAEPAPEEAAEPAPEEAAEPAPEEAAELAPEEAAEPTAEPAAEPEPEAQYVTFGKYKNKDIEWIELESDGEKTMMISRYVLDSAKYDKAYGVLTWADCSLRRWLNNDFLKAAFSEEEQKAIVKIRVDNSDAQGNPEWNSRGGASTDDKVYLLSYAEVMTYFDTLESRKCEPTAYAKNSGVLTSTEDGITSCWWWTRSPGSQQLNAAGVRPDGSIMDDHVDFEDGGVRPVIWVDNTLLAELS